jgi:glioma pathogenesis-related protein 2
MGNCASSDRNKFLKDHLNAHNEYRAQHGCPPLKLSHSLSKYAQEWAEKLATRGSMEHRPDGKYGENIYMRSGTPTPIVNGKMPVDAWYGEIKYYSFGTGGFSSKTGHFTQVVWKESTKMGVGKAMNR